MWRLLGASLVAVCIGSAVRAVESPPVAALIEKLGSEAFADREAAARELLRQGPTALDLLKTVSETHTDPEIRQRAAGLIEQIKRSTDTARLIAPKTVRLDYQQVQLGAALADLRTKTGVPLTLDPLHVSDPLRTITAKSGELPVWEAIEAFCQQAGLKEVFQETLGGTNDDQMIRGRRRIAYAVPGQMPTETAGQVPLVLMDGTSMLPGDRSASVRVIALPPGFSGNRVIRGSGQVVLNLDVTPLAGLKWDDVTAVRVLKAEDETGRPVTTSHRLDQRIGGNGMFEDVNWIGGMQQAVIINEFGTYTGGAMSRPNPRIVPVTLKTDDRSIRSLRIFEGVIVGEITLTNQQLAMIPDLAKSVGFTAFGPSDTKFTLLDYKNLPNGRVSLKIRSDGPNPWTNRQFAKRAGFNISNIVMFDNSTATNGTQFKFTDAAGNILPQPQVQGTSMSDDGVRQSSEMDLVFPKRSDLGPPANWIVIGNKPAAVEVPFRMKNVLLP